jgi:phospholipid/cholesterol/gamma-HCH transport system substrate-binding protein
VNEGVKLPADTIASIRTEGLLGASYVALSPGSASRDLRPGGRISQTEPALDLVDLLVKYGLKPKGEGQRREPEL